MTNTANAAYDYDCSGSKPAVAAYTKSPVYTIVGLANDYRSSDSATSLNTSSNIVRAVGGGGTGCSNGLTVVGGQGTFYAAAITAAQSYLAANGRTGAQKVIIILSDGDAQSSTEPNTLNECGQAVTTASAAKTAGTWIYTIGYAAQTTTAPSGSCANDTSPKTSACATLQSMATDSAHFFYDTPSTCTGGRSVSNVQSAFQQVANSLMAPTLIPYSG